MISKLNYKPGTKIELLNKEGKIVSHIYEYFWIWHGVGYIGRKKNKKTHQIFRTEKGWTQGSIGQKRPLFGLETIDRSPDVHWVEGEKCQNLLSSKVNKAVVTSVGGAASVRLTDYTQLYGRTVYLHRDNDQQGLAAVEKIAEILKDQAIIYIVHPPKNKPENWDIADDLNEIHNDQSLNDHCKLYGVRYLKEIEPKEINSQIERNFSPSIEKAKEELKKIIIPKDPNGKWAVGRDFFTIHLKNNLVFIADKNGFLYLYDNNHFRIITETEFNNILLAFPDLNSSSNYYKSEVRKQLVSEVLVPELEKRWRSIDTYKIALQDGIYDLKTKSLQAHSVEHYLDSVLKYNWNPNAKNNIWLEFLAQTFEDDPEKISALQEFCGYTLLPVAKAKKALFCLGPKNSGKSVFGHCISKLHGSENVCSIPIKSIDDPTALFQIVGKSLNLVPEIGQGEMIPDASFKSMVSTGEPIQVRQLYVGYTSYVPFAKHIFLSNNTPQVKDATDATLERMLPIEFINTVPSNLIDIDLPDKIMSNPEGLLNWCIEGAIRLSEQNFIFTMPKSSKEFLAKYRQTTGNFKWFLQEYFISKPDALTDYQSAYALLKKVRTLFNGYTELNSIRSEKGFTNFLKASGLETLRTTDPEKSDQKRSYIAGIFPKNPDTLRQLETGSNNYPVQPNDL